ncbi:bifunctional DNA-formamidopyrimidine glycosylase/DNA-(apurinic or apyrimidinic site) lyase [Candidatus Daviesbacteria bacterium]|nr:bifunctional DNA-formamidopyrimidine glycosylase/DNA-(apurinic or apyrimidinic site) lyase [Candidatus Daviesbacteria bacterium]
MPELPEVETIKLGLERKIIGLKIKSVEVLEPKSFICEGLGPFDCAQGLRGKNILKVWRRAKVLGINLDSLRLAAPLARSSTQASCGFASDTLASGSSKTHSLGDRLPPLTILFHLKMSGQLILVQKKDRFVGGHPTHDMASQMPIKSTRVIFEFSDPLRPRSEASGSELYFNDQRKFGWIKVVNTADLDKLNYGMQKAFGPEPLEPGFTCQKLSDNLKKKQKSNIKQALLDQTVVAGLGNIYVSEALFLAKIDPRRKVSSLSDSDYTRLFRSIKEALRSGILHGGSSRTHFVNEAGKKGYFLDFAYVYGREDQLCKVCSTKIAKIRLGGRGTTFCPKCQK